MRKHISIHTYEVVTPPADFADLVNIQFADLGSNVNIQRIDILYVKEEVTHNI